MVIISRENRERSFTINAACTLSLTLRYTLGHFRGRQSIQSFQSSVATVHSFAADCDTSDGYGRTRYVVGVE